MIQTHWVIKRLQQQWPNLEISIEQIRTTGDRVADMPLSQIGGDGVFVTEIERALRESRIDLAVHSLKDLPTAQPEGVCIVVAGPREDVRDVFVTHNTAWQPQTWHYLSPGQGEGAQGVPLQTWHPQGVPLHFAGMTSDIRIGTCSLRRMAQIRALWPGAQILPLRGNVDTRLHKLEANEYDAIVLAAAGLHRMDLQERLSGRITYFPIELMMPAPGQGALALEIRDDPEMQALVVPLHDPLVQAATSAERMFMRYLGAGCYLPVAAYGAIAEHTFTLLGLVISLDGQRQVRVRQSMDWSPASRVEDAGQLGVKLAEQALAQGAAEIIDAVNFTRMQERHHV